MRLPTKLSERKRVLGKESTLMGMKHHLFKKIYPILMINLSTMPTTIPTFCDHIMQHKTECLGITINRINFSLLLFETLTPTPTTSTSTTLTLILTLQHFSIHFTSLAQKVSNETLLMSLNSNVNKALKIKDHGITISILC